MNTRFGRVVNMLAILLVIAYGAIEYVVPKVATMIWKNDYQSLMFQCDQTMKEHFIAKQLVLAEPSAKAVRNLKANEVGLLRCHEYDKLRKQLLSYGVSEAHLGLLGLEVLEEKATDLQRFVEIHEIRY